MDSDDEESPTYTHPQELIIPSILSELRHLDLTGHVEFAESKVVPGGGYGDICTARCNLKDRARVKVAVKRLRFYLKEDIQALFDKEIYVWAKLDHKNILPLLGYAFEQVTYYPLLVSEWMRTGSAWQFVNKHDDCNLIRIVTDIARGLAYLHDKGVVHSDIKSDNILISNTGDALICDFGCSRMVESSRSYANISTNTRGTDRYLAPELITPPYSRRSKESDVWAFGMTVYELLARQRPFTGVIPTLAISRLELPSCPPFAASPPKEVLWEICQMCWVQNPEGRPDIVTLLDRLEGFPDSLLLRHLHPVTEVSYKEDKICFKGSRIDTLRAIEAWSESESSPPLFWLYGSPGLGKTTISHTVAKRFRDQNRLAGYFFLVNEQSPDRIMPTIAYQMAKWHADYHANILDVLRGREELDLYSGLSSQFDLLMKRPFLEMSMRSPPIHKPLIIVLDGLENCNNMTNCRQSFADYIMDIATLVPWLKVFVSSRVLEDIELRSRRVEVQSLLIDDPVLDLHHDIAAYARLCMERRDALKEWSPGMTNDVRCLLERISGSLVALSAIPSAESLEPTVDSWDIEGFFRVVIKNVIEREEFHDDDILAIRRILAAASYMTPIQTPTGEALYHVLQPIQPSITPDHLNAVISRLSPIVYTNSEDITRILFPTGIFLKFLVKEYHGRFQSDVESIKRRSALHALHAELKFNVCGLGNPQLANKNVPDLEEKLDSHVSETLRYFSLHWMDLVADMDDIQSCDEAVIGFLCSPKVIFWIEVLSLLGELDTGKSMLSKCVDHFKDEDRIVDAATDLLAFISEFEPSIALSTPHIYISILLWLPSDSLIRRGIRPRIPKIVFEIIPEPASDVVRIDSKNDILCTTRSPYGSRIVSGSTDGTLGIWDGVTGTRIGKKIKEHTNYVNDVTYSPDGTSFVSGSDDGTVKIWDVTGKLVMKMESDSGVRAAAVSADGRRVVSGHGYGTVRIWNAQNGDLIAGFRGHEDDVFAVAYSPDGSRIVSGSNDNTVRIWDAQSGASVGEPLKGHEKSVFAVAYSPDGSRIVSGSWDATVRIWDARTGKQIGEPLKGHEHGVVDVGYSQDGSRIISASDDDIIRFWDAANGDQFGVLLRGESRWDAECQHFISIPNWWPASWWKSFTIQSLVYSSNPLYVPEDGWIRTLDGDLLLWVPPQHRRCSCHAAPESTITANDCDERLKTSAWKDIPQGANWAKMMNVEESD
ncbi:hypothetical protein ACEPAI_4477 [Sanghuangporus weigelae]